MEKSIGLVTIAIARRASKRSFNLKAGRSGRTTNLKMLSTWRQTMRFTRLISVSTITLLVALSAAAQDQGGRGHVEANAAPMPEQGSVRSGGAGGSPRDDDDDSGLPRRRPNTGEVQSGGRRRSPWRGHIAAINWANPPAGTQSFVLNMHDMDVSRNKTTDDQAHWVVWNIPATATGLREGMPKGSQLPDGSYQISATGQVYRGPGAPANGPPHHYTFELYALDTKLDVQPTADAFETRANVMKALQGHILGKAVYGGLFKRPQ